MFCVVRKAPNQAYNIVKILRTIMIFQSCLLQKMRLSEALKAEIEAGPLGPVAYALKDSIRMAASS